MAKVHAAKTEADLRRCHPVVVQLRPHLDEARFVSMVKAQQKEGYRVAFIESRGAVAAFAGYRIMHMLHQGRVLYVDDLVTDERTRSKGLGGHLLDWLIDEARRSKCDCLELDSGVQRVGAHRFYLQKGLHIDSYHFRIPLTSAPPRILGSRPEGVGAKRT